MSNIFKHRPILIYLLGCYFFCQPIQAEEFNLRGRVLNSSGDPLLGTSVRLLKNNIEVETLQDGSFIIDNKVAVNGVHSFTKKLTISNKMLTVNISETQSFAVEILTLQGKSIRTVKLQLTQGIHSFSIYDLVGDRLSSGIYLISINCDHKVIQQKILYLGNNQLSFVGLSKNLNFTSNKNRNYRTVIDTLEVSYPGLFVERIPVEFYQGAIPAITLNSLKDELTIAKAFKFSKAPIFKKIHGTSDSLIYVGDNFDLIKNLSDDVNDIAISWETSSSIYGNSAELNIQNGKASVKRGSLTMKAKEYTVKAKAAVNGKNTSVDFKFKVLSESLKIMVWNIWGKNGDKYPYTYNGQNTLQKKRVSLLIKEHDPDVVGMIESYGQMNYLKSQLPDHRYHYGGESSGDNISILSKHYIAKNIDMNSYSNYKGAEIDLSDDRKFIFFSTWFDWHESNWPRDADKVSDAQGVAFDIHYRLPEAKELTSFIKNNGYMDNSDNSPVFIVGDHNSISHLDYTEETAGTDQNYGRGVIKSPVSMHIADNDFIDSYRELNPSPLESPGMTYDAFNVNFTDPWISWKCHFRIDYIYYKATKIVPLESFVVDKFLDGNSTNNAFPSDHAAVITVFEWLD